MSTDRTQSQPEPKPNLLDPPAHLTRAAVVEAAREFLGVPYVHQGRSPHYGLDCIGLIWCVAVWIGYDVPILSDYPENRFVPELEEGLKKYLVEKPTLEAKPGDVLLFKFGNHPQHTAIRTDVGIIHAYHSTGVNKVSEHVLTGWWQSKIVAVFEFPGIEDG